MRLPGVAIVVAVLLLAMSQGGSAEAFPEVTCPDGVQLVREVKGECGFTLYGYVPRGTTITVASISTIGLIIHFQTTASYFYAITNLPENPVQGRIYFSGPGLEPTFSYAFNGVEQGTLDAGSEAFFPASAWVWDGVRSISVYR
jgi:hypothetical protein